MHHPTNRIIHTTAFVTSSRGALAGTRNSSMCPPHEGSIRRPIAPWANALTTELHLAPIQDMSNRTSVTLFIDCHYYYFTIILSRVLSYSSHCKCNETPSGMVYSRGWTTTSYPGMTQTFLRRRHTHLVWRDGGL